MMTARLPLRCSGGPCGQLADAHALRKGSAGEHRRYCSTQNTATRAYLDTNAASYVFDRKGFAASELRLLRTRMKDASCAGEIEFVISVPLLEELSGIARRDWSRYRTILDFLFEISGPRLLLEADERLRGELDNSGPLDGLKPYQSRRFRLQLQAATKVRKNASKVDDGTYGRKDKWKTFGEALRQQMKDQLAGIGLRPADLRSAWKIIGPNIDSWTTDALRRRREELGLPKDESRWPPARDLPTAWLAEAYTLARMVPEVALGRRIEPSGGYDAEHVSAGGYYDTRYKPLRTSPGCCDLIRHTSSVVTRFNS